MPAAQPGSNARFTLQWFLGEKLPIYRITEKSARNQHGSHYNDFSAISRRGIGGEIAEKISRPTERHLTSHVINLDICEFLILDARRWRRLYITKKCVVTCWMWYTVIDTCWIGCMWATDTWKSSQKMTNVDDGHAAAYTLGCYSAMMEQNSRISSAWTRQFLTTSMVLSR